MPGYTPGFLDRLLGAEVGAPDARPAAVAEQLKDAVARDLEALLNTRLGYAPGIFARYPECRNSVLNYGLVDFAGYCLSSDDDRAAVCAALTAAIGRHEPRLRRVDARLDLAEGSVNHLNFVISGVLQMPAGAESVSFNAVLQPSTMQYAIGRARSSSPR